MDTRCLLIIFILTLASSTAKLLEKKTEILDPDSKYSITWQVDDDEKTIEFEATVETTGYIGFGISAAGKMNEADLFIAGVVENGSWYSLDKHGVGNTPVADSHHDWNLVFAEENSTHTYIKFRRLLNTCDDEDFPITNDTTRVIWSYGATDELVHHGVNRGTKSFSFLTPELLDWDPLAYQRFDITTEITMPADDTTYWCTIHRGPNVSGKNHIVSFEALLDNPDALQHTHHFILTMCHAPPEMNATELFEPHVGGNGSQCYVLPEDQTLPLDYCLEYIYVWAVGGRPVRFPKELGYPFGESREPIYYRLEVHYNNPSKISGLTFKTGLSIYYTNELRSIDIGQMGTPHGRDLSLIVPPMTSDFVISTHCAPTCTNRIPPEGIKIFNVLLHSHLAGRKMNFRHFRNGTELPWILRDNNYDFNFQQNAPLDPVTILPGDHLTVECVYDSMDRNNTIVSGGHSSNEEMCETVYFYYPRISLVDCGSQYPYRKGITGYGVTNYTLKPVNNVYDMPWIWAPEELAGPNGTDYITMLNTRFNWTKEYIEQMRISRQYGEHEFRCIFDNEEPIFGLTKYPEIDDEYIEKDSCSPPSPTTPTPTTTTKGTGTLSTNSVIHLIWSVLLSAYYL